MGARLIAPGLLALCCAVAPSDAVGQDRVVAARFSAELGAADGSATVSVAYDVTLEGGAEGTGRPLEVTLLAPEGVSARDVALVSGDPVAFEEREGLRLRGRVRAPAPAPGGVRTLVFRYRVEGSVTGEGGAVLARVPVLSLSLPPDAERGDVFAAEVEVPGGWRVSETFPTGLRTREGGRLSGALPVVPSTVIVRGRTDGAWRPGASLIVELLAAIALLAFAVRGGRHLKARSA